jgi:peptide/nickel transport system ATP-binding protein
MTGHERPGGPLLKAAGLSVTFRRGGDRHQTFLAVDDVTFEIGSAEVLALVGESGSGKTTVCRVLAGLQRPSGGVVTLDGRPVWPGRESHDRPVPAGSIGMVFQNAQESLDPRQRVASAIGEALATAAVGRASQIAAGAADLVRLVGLPESSLSARARELSGGQAQRVALARALATQPRLLVLDEPVSALDVSLQSQILNLLRTIQRDLQLAYLFVTHDLAVARQLADTVAVMFGGRIVECGPRDSIFSAPGHPYTRQLLASAPRRTSRPADITAAGPDESVGHQRGARSGCGYVDRCQLWRDLGKPERCLSDRPSPAACGDAVSHAAACHYAGAHQGSALAPPGGTL